MVLDGSGVVDEGCGSPAAASGVVVVKWPFVDELHIGRRRATQLRCPALHLSCLGYSLDRRGCRLSWCNLHHSPISRCPRLALETSHKPPFPAAHALRACASVRIYPRSPGP